MVITILQDADTSDPSERQGETSSSSTSSVAFPHYDLTSSSKWIGFVQSEPPRKKRWLSVASVYTREPYSAPVSFDIDAMVELAENKAIASEDELWLLQTDLDFFHYAIRRHEGEWLDSVPGVEELNMFSPEEKMDNIGYIMTVKVAVQARDWQWLLEECRTVKRIIGASDAGTCEEGHLPFEYERALCGLEYLLKKAQTWYQDCLVRLFVKSQAFRSTLKITATGKDQGKSWALGFDFKDYSRLYQNDRLGWCLYNLTKNPADPNTFELSVVLQHLQKFLDTCPHSEIQRIDQEMYKCISDIATIERMLGILELHRPNFAFVAQNPFHQPSQAWQVHSNLRKKPSKMTCEQMDLGSALEASTRFRMPTGRRDEQWLAQRDLAQKCLSDLWKKVRQAYQISMKASEVPQSLIEPQLAMMKQGDSLENKAQLDLEKGQVLARLKAAREKASARSAIPPKDATGGFSPEHTQPARRIPEPAKEKTKTRPENTSASGGLQAKYAAAFASLSIDEEPAQTEKPPPVLYTLEPNSVELRVISLMFPDRSQGIEEGAGTVDWLDFVSTMVTLGFAAEHRGGSAFTFKGAVRLPGDPSALQKRSIGVHMPHPSTEMGPVMLQSLGRRCNRRFGWQRGNFRC